LRVVFAGGLSNNSEPANDPRRKQGEEGGARIEGEGMKKIENQTLVKETLVLEEIFFVNCVVRECSLFYSGGDFDWVNTRFENCQLLFRDSAKRTMALVQQFGMLKKEGELPAVGGTSSTRVQ
jgi:hypothetical protein